MRHGLLDMPLDGARKRRWSRLASRWLVDKVRRTRTPVGRWLGTEQGRRRFADRAAGVVHNLLRRQAPGLIKRFDIKSVVFRQIMRFDLHKVERMVRDLIDNELGAIVELGIFIGLAVGLMMPLLQLLLSAASQSLWTVVALGYSYLCWRLYHFLRALKR